MPQGLLLQQGALEWASQAQLLRESPGTQALSNLPSINLSSKAALKPHSKVRPVGQSPVQGYHHQFGSLWNPNSVLEPKLSGYVYIGMILSKYSLRQEFLR